MKLYFLYLAQNGRAIPQLWYGNKTDGQGKSLDNNVLFKVEIERALPLNVLIKMYPHELKE